MYLPSGLDTASFMSYHSAGSAAPSTTNQLGEANLHGAAVLQLPSQGLQQSALACQPTNIAIISAGQISWLKTGLCPAGFTTPGADLVQRMDTKQLFAKG